MEQNLILGIVGSINIGVLITIIKMFVSIGSYRQQVDKHEKKIGKIEEKVDCIDVIKNRLNNVEKRDADIKEIFVCIDRLREDTATIKATLSMMNSSKLDK